MQISGASSAAQATQIQQWRDRLFQRADQDRNGGLSLDEFSALAARRREASPANSAEAPADPAQVAGGSAVQDIFRRLDSNGDGSLDKAELDAARPARAGQGQTATLSSATFTALLNSQGSSGNSARAEGRQTRQREQSDRSQSQVAAAASDAALQRQLAAYQARQAAAPTGATSLSA